ncbi:DUF3253 domain-containing protein [Pseudobacteriovorax antillogorgiicola]|uniref:DUF2256 and DUF3253 domain-containing protein n=1 Tax=Pseudobacteriovorax antillogorgiicola TaxID=1513793 RepID=A0A1Y6CRD2_9BACT|nr:DUF3253 domain-containing protein [Pseudobacteriovorax antillogorgiicola]TCS41803.1 uncharacterized protein DUF2256 [Pseudobacteriovorax antillogorgiicola]SMF83459.1 hypothetical protein SAMN06296036_1474 [Pseudobacteriovorax antillogorgiicola]
MNEQPDYKICVVCGLKFSKRAKWLRDWHAVRYCSERCRRQKITSIDLEIEDAMLDLAQIRWQRSQGSLCPSEVAMKISDGDWRPMMERVRQAARRLAHADKIEILQANHPVEPTRFRGPIRLRWKA